MPVCISDIENSSLKGKDITEVFNYGSNKIAKDTDGKLHSWGNGIITESNIPVCISDTENSELRNKKIKNIGFCGYNFINRNYYINYYITEDGGCYMYSYSEGEPT